MKERQTQIIRLLGQEERISVARLSELLDTSQVTIRKDLDQLEEQGFVRRQHGFAIQMSQDNVAGRLLFRYEVKLSIARRAAALVSDGETVMIESGSTCALLTRELAKSRREVTVVTNSAFLADFVKDEGSLRVVLLGGDYQPESKVTVGAIARLAARQFYVDKLFCGTDGFTEDYGFTILNHLRAETVAEMGRRANRVIVLTDSTKFHQRGVANQFAFREVDTVITDDGIPPETKQLLEEQHLQVLWVKSEQERGEDNG